MKIKSIGAVQVVGLSIVYPDNYDELLTEQQRLYIQEINANKIGKTVVGKLLEKAKDTAEKAVKVVGDVLLLPLATLLKGIIAGGGLLEKAGASFIYLFATPEQIKLLPESELKKRERQIKIMRFFDKAPFLNMKESTFKKQVRNGILSKYKKQPEVLISDYLKRKGIGNAYTDFVYYSPKVLDLQVKRNLLTEKIKDTYNENKAKWKEQKVKGIGVPPVPPQVYIAAAQAAAELLQNLLKIIDGAKSKDKLEVDGDITPEPTFFEKVSDFAKQTTDMIPATQATEAEKMQQLAEQTAAAAAEAAEAAGKETKKDDNTMLYVGGGLALAAVIYFATLKK